MAKKFQFRLEKVLDLRRDEADVARLYLGEAEQARLQKESEVQDMQHYYESLVAESRKGKTSVQTLESHWYHIRAVRSQITVLERECVQLAEIEEARRRELAEAMKKQRVLEKLKENKRLEHNREVEREEQNFLDDIAQRTGRSPFH